MDSEQLRILRDIREDLESIRGNEQEVELIRRRINHLIRDSVEEAKNKIEVLANLDKADQIDIEDVA